MRQIGHSVRPKQKRSRILLETTVQRQKVQVYVSPENAARWSTKRSLEAEENKCGVKALSVTGAFGTTTGVSGKSEEFGGAKSAITAHSGVTVQINVERAGER